MYSADYISFWRDGQTTSALEKAGLIAVSNEQQIAELDADARAVIEKARDQFGASHVFLRSFPGRSMVPEALVFDDAEDGKSRSFEEFAKLHRRLWSWGAVPLVYRRLSGRIDVFRCAHKPDFDSGEEQPKYSPHGSLDLLELASNITQLLEANPWWDIRRLANGTLWDDRNVAKQFLSDDSAHKTILRKVEALEKHLADKSRLAANLRRRLLIVCLLVAYLEDREVFKLEPGFFSRFKLGATKFHHVLADAKALIELLKHLETERFNGNVFKLEADEKEQLLKTPHLRKFAELIEGTTENGGQQTLWRLYSFRDLPVELISHIYQLFVEDKTTCVYTPPFLARLMLEEALSLARMDRLEERNEVVFDPSCGSGVFLVEAFKRLVLHWRKTNAWAQPPVDVLRKLMRRVRGTDVDGYAVELAAFSLCLAMCEELSAQTISRTHKLFPTLNGQTLIKACFFKQASEKQLPFNIGVVVGNPPFGSASKVGTTEQAYHKYLKEHGKNSLPDRQSAYLFLHHSMEALNEDGLLCLIQKDNFLYNRRSSAFRRAIFKRWNVRQILDFTPIRGIFLKDPKVVVVMAEANKPKEDRSILHAIFRRTVHTQAELSFELDYYDMQWVSHQDALSKDFIWRCNLFGGGRSVSLVERLKKLPTLNDHILNMGWNHGIGFQVGTPKNKNVVKYLYGKNVLPAKAINKNGSIQEELITCQSEKYFVDPGREAIYKSPLLLIARTDELRFVFWDASMGNITFGKRILGISSAGAKAEELTNIAKRFRNNEKFYQAWICLTSSDAGIKQATTVEKEAFDDIPLPADESDLDLTINDQIVIEDAVNYYRDFQRLGDDADIMRECVIEDQIAFAEIFTKQINVIHKKLRPLTPLKWAGVSCQPFVFGEIEPDWKDAETLDEKLSQLMYQRKGTSLTKVRTLRIFDGPFVFLIKPNRLRYWLRSIALRDADEALADLRNLGF